MALMAWDESYSVNVREIDSQHRRLVRLLNELHEAMKFGRSRDGLGEIFHEVVEYAKYHFATEERLMREARFPDYLLHRAVHEDVISRLADFHGQFDDRGPAITMMTLQFFRDWLRNHFVAEDQAIGRYVNSAGISRLVWPVDLSVH